MPSTRTAELALLDSMDMGKPVTVAHTMDVPGAAAVFAFYAEAIDKTYGEVAPNGSGAHAFVTRVPLGVAAAITAWNYPLETASWKLAPAPAPTRRGHRQRRHRQIRRNSAAGPIQSPE